MNTAYSNFKCSYLKVVGIINWILVHLLAKQRYGVTDKQMSNVLCQQVIHSSIPELLVDFAIVHYILIIVLSAGQIAVDCVVPRLWNDKFVFFEWLHKSIWKRKKKDVMSSWVRKRKKDVRSGIRTHAYKSRLRPERSALDRSAILTTTTINALYTGIIVIVNR